MPLKLEQVGHIILNKILVYVSIHPTKHQWFQSSLIHTLPHVALCFICGCLSYRDAVEKLHCVDDAFRRQLESIQAAHQAELLQLANEKQKQIEQANQRVR